MVPEGLRMADRHKLLTWSHRRTAYLLVFLVAFAMTEAGRNVYRPFVYRSGWRDLGIADTMGNHLGAVTLVFFILAVMHATYHEGLIVVGVVTFGYIAYEFAQPLLPGSTADTKDAVASVVGGVASWWLLRWTCRRAEMPTDPGWRDVARREDG